MTELVTFEDQTVELLPDRTTMALVFNFGVIAGRGGNAYQANLGLVNVGNAAVGGNGVQIG